MWTSKTRRKVIEEEESRVWQREEWMLFVKLSLQRERDGRKKKGDTEAAEPQDIVEIIIAVVKFVSP
jgi:hypothetical protein